MSLTPEQIEGLKQFEAERKDRIKRVMDMYVEVNGKLVKKNKLDPKKEITIFDCEKYNNNQYI